MLPFMNAKKIASLVISKRAGKGEVEIAPEVEAPGSEMDPGLKAAAEDILRAIESKSVMDLAQALQSAYSICDSMPGEDS